MINKIYKLKFDKCRNELVVVSEITAGMGKEKSTGHIADLSALSLFRKILGTLTPLAFLTGLIAGLLPAMVLANPDLPADGQIVGGQGSISTSGNQMIIHQQTQNMATNWHSFDVGQNNTVQFVQPDSSSVALNRVTGASGSQIMGTLEANGQVFILNPNGVLFGKSAQVNVAGLVASTKNLSTADFMKGQYTLSGSGTPGAQVVNQGCLTTSTGGYIVLAGEQVSNSGTVITPGGKTALAAGETVTLQLDNSGLTSVSVNGSVVNALVDNHGLISATNGQVYLTAKGQDMILNTVVNNSGNIEAKGLARQGGEIMLNGGDSGMVSQSGQLLADSLTDQGGKVIMEGQNIHLAGSSLTSASGKTGGGEVYVGGGRQGQDSHIKNASKVLMDKTATVDVSAKDAGNGGTAVLLSDDYTSFLGTVLAKGGAQSGNGGQVETSSYRNLQAFGAVDASAHAGRGGEWLLDTTNVTIIDPNLLPIPDSESQIFNTSIEAPLNAGTNVTVKTHTSGNIKVSADIIKAAGVDTKLSLLADNTIDIDSRTIKSLSGKLDISLTGGGDINIKGGQISTNGGSILLTNVPAIAENSMSIFIGDHAIWNTSSLGQGLPSGDVTITANQPNNKLYFRNNPKLIANNINLLSDSNVFINYASMTADKRINITSNNGEVRLQGPFYYNGKTYSKNVILSAGQELLISGPSVILDRNIDITAGGEIKLNGASDIFFANKSIIKTPGSLFINNSNTTANILIQDSTLDSGSTLMLYGYAEKKDCSICIDHSSLKGTNAVINTINKKDNGTAIGIANTSLLDGLASLSNIVLNSDGATNAKIDLGAMLDSNNFIDFLKRNQIKNNRVFIYMKGKPFLNDYLNYINDDLLSKKYSLVFNDTIVNDITHNFEINNVGFNKSTINIPNGSLYMDGVVYLNDTTVNVNGDVRLDSKGSMTLSGSTINANDGVSIRSNGVINASNVSIVSHHGDIILNQDILNSGILYYSYDTGLNLTGANFISDSGLVDISVKSGVLSGIDMGGISSFKTKQGTNIYAELNYTKNNRYIPPYAIGIAPMASLTFDGGAKIRTSSSFNGVSLLPLIVYPANHDIYVKNGDLSISSTLTGAQSAPTGAQGSPGSGAIVFQNAYNSSTLSIFVDKGSSVYIDADTSNNGPLNYPAFATANSDSTGSANKVNGIILNGEGDVHIKGTSASGNAVILRLIDNRNLTGKLYITGKSDSGNGIIFDDFIDVNVSNAYIVGESKSGNGILMTALDGRSVNLLNNTITGSTEKGMGGIILSGNNIAITNGTLSGTAASGDGIKITGDMTLVNADLKGQTGSGNGVNIVGNLAMDNTTTIQGQSFGLGTGVFLMGASIHGAKIVGTSQDGTGIKTEGKVETSNARLIGYSKNGSGLVSLGTLLHSPDTIITYSSGTGKNDQSGVTPSLPFVPETDSRSDKTVVHSFRQDAVNAQVTQMNLPARAGFHTTGIPSVPVDGYELPTQMVDISLCGTDAQCTLMLLDAGKPTDEQLTSSGS